MVDYDAWQKLLTENDPSPAYVVQCTTLFGDHYMGVHGVGEDNPKMQEIRSSIAVLELTLGLFDTRWSTEAWRIRWMEKNQRRVRWNLFRRVEPWRGCGRVPRRFHEEFQQTESDRATADVVRLLG